MVCLSVFFGQLKDWHVLDVLLAQLSQANESEYAIRMIIQVQRRFDCFSNHTCMCTAISVPFR